MTEGGTVRTSYSMSELGESSLTEKCEEVWGCTNIDFEPSTFRLFDDGLRRKEGGGCSGRVLRGAQPPIFCSRNQVWLEIALPLLPRLCPFPARQPHLSCDVWPWLRRTSAGMIRASPTTLPWNPR